MGLKVSVISTHHFHCTLKEINNMQPDGRGCVPIGPYLQNQILSRIWPKIQSLLISTVWIYFEQHLSRGTVERYLWSHWTSANKESFCPFIKSHCLSLCKALLCKTTLCKAIHGYRIHVACQGYMEVPLNYFTVDGHLRGFQSSAALTNTYGKPFRINSWKWNCWNYQLWFILVSYTSKLNIMRA